MKKIKKFLLFSAVICMLPLVAFLIAGCKGNSNDNNTNKDGKITLTFATDFGSLSFSSKELTLNSEGNAYITINDCPVISNEGDAKLFDCWTLSSGENVNFDNAFTKDTTIKAKFKNASMVAKANWGWKENQSILSITHSIHSVEVSGKTTIAGSPFHGITFEKVADEDVLANDYVTREQIVSTYEKACFITSGNSAMKYIKHSDLTTNTYRLSAFIVISPNEDTVRSVGYFDYFPHGVHPFSGVTSLRGVSGTVGHTAVLYNYGTSTISSEVFNAKAVTCLGQNSQLTNNQSEITAIRGYNNLSSAETFDNYDNYYIFVEADGYKFSFKMRQDAEEEYYYTRPNDGSLKKVSKEEFDNISY